MSEDNYTTIGKTVVWIVANIFIPMLVSIIAGIWVNTKYYPQPDRKKKKTV